MDRSPLRTLRYSWLIFSLSAAFLFFKYILQISPAVMSQDLMERFSLTATSLGFLVGFYFYTYLIMQIPSGILLDKFGVKKLTSFALLCCTLGIYIFSISHVFFWACVGRLLIGFGAAFATTSYMKVATLWFPSHYFPFLSGLFGTACMAGAGTAEAPLAWLVHALGWQQAITWITIIGLLLSILTWYIISDTPPVDLQKNQGFQWQALLKVLRNRKNWPLILFGGLAFTPVSVFGGLWGVPFLMTAYHLPKVEAASAVSLVFFGFALGGIIIGWIGKLVNSQLLVMILGTLGSLVFLSFVLYLTPLPLALLRLFIFAFGFFASSFLLSYALARTLNPASVVASIIGVINMGDPLFGAIAEPMIGKILDLNWTGETFHQVHLYNVKAYQMGLSLLTVYLILALISCYFMQDREGAAQPGRQNLATASVSQAT